MIVILNTLNNGNGLPESVYNGEPSEGGLQLAHRQLQRAFEALWTALLVAQRGQNRQKGEGGGSRPDEAVHNKRSGLPLPRSSGAKAGRTALRCLFCERRLLLPQGWRYCQHPLQHRRLCRGAFRAENRILPCAHVQTDRGLKVAAEVQPQVRPGSQNKRFLHQHCFGCCLIHAAIVIINSYHQTMHSRMPVIVIMRLIVDSDQTDKTGIDAANRRAL